MKMIFKLAMTMFFALCVTQAAKAITIDYTVENTEGNRWQYNYTIYNDSHIDIQAFDIFFDFNDGPYSDLELIAWYSDGGWDADIFPEFIWGGIEEPWMLSAWTYEAPLSYGEKLEGYSVAFNWSGNEAPGSQIFRLWDSDWAEAGTGWTSNSEDMPPVPEPGTLVLLGTGVVGLAAYYRSRNAKKH